MVLVKKINKVLAITSAAAFVVIVLVLVMVPIVLLGNKYGGFANDFLILDSIHMEIVYEMILMDLAGLYVFMYAPGVIVSVVYAIYIRRRFLGRPRSYPIEAITLLVAAQTVFVFYRLY